MAFQACSVCKSASCSTEGSFIQKAISEEMKQKIVNSSYDFWCHTQQRLVFADEGKSCPDYRPDNK